MKSFCSMSFYRNSCLCFAIAILVFMLFSMHLGNAMDMDKVRLKSGTEVPKLFVSEIIKNIKKLMKEDGAAFYELVGHCQHGNDLDGDISYTLARFSLFNSEKGFIPQPTKDVVLTVVVDDGAFGVKLVNPISEKK